MSAADAKWKDRDQMTVLNRPQRRVDGPLKATGRAVYTHDVRLPRMVYARLVLHTFPRAEVFSIDLQPALDLPGVVAAGRLKEDGEALIYLGDDSAYAWVAATSPEAARDAARALRADLENQFQALITREAALEKGAPEIIEGSRRIEGNVSGERSRGDFEQVGKLIDEAAHSVSATYTLPIQHHLCLETHGHVVDYDGTQATIYASTQMVSDSVGEYASLLGLSADRVRVVCEVMGGGFGSKFGAGLEGRVACEIAKELKRPVHLMLDRPQEFQMAGNRSGSVARMAGGVNADGRLVALTADVDRLGGVGGGSFPRPPYIYSAEESATTLRSVHTAMDSNRAMRAPGHPQASFAMESLMDELAAKGGFDSVDFRKRNLDDEVWQRHLDRVAEAIGWGSHPNRTGPGREGADGWAEGIGFGCSTWRAGGRPGAGAEVRILPDGSVISACGVQDLGTGARTYVAGIAAEELGLPLEAVTARIGDSDLPPGVASGGSVTTGSVAPAVLDAAHNARVAFEKRLAESTGIAAGDYVFEGGRVRGPEGSDFDLSFAEAASLLGTRPVIENGSFQSDLVATGSLHGAQAARVRVDTFTGRVEVVKMVAIHDQGLILNRLALTSQINGGITKALSYGLLEERVVDEGNGWFLNANMETYKAVGMQEMPEIEVILDDEDDRPVTGMAEAPVIPGHSAIANAIFNACGARVRSVPFTPDRVLEALAARG